MANGATLLDAEDRRRCAARVHALADTELVAWLHRGAVFDAEPDSSPTPSQP